MPHPLILGHLTVLDCPPPEVVTIAAETGFGKIGLRMIPSRADSVHYPLDKQPAVLEETLRRLTDTGVTVFDFDVIRLTPQTDIASLKPIVEIGARLGAESVLVTAGDPEPSRFRDNLAALCDLTGVYGISADLEYMLFTPTVPDMATAIEVVRSTGRGNAGVLVDTIHFDRLGGDFEELKAAPRDLIHYVHLTDARKERPAVDKLTEDSRAYRMMPGEGGLDLVSFVQALPPDTPLCIEVSNAELDRSLSARDRAKRALDGTKALLAAAGRQAA